MTTIMDLLDNYPHPRYLHPVEHASKRYREVNRRIRAQYYDFDLPTEARNYFGQELMRGAKIETLKTDPYWKYMED